MLKVLNQRPYPSGNHPALFNRYDMDVSTMHFVTKTFNPNLSTPNPSCNRYDMDLSTKPYKALRYHSYALRAAAFHPGGYPLFASASDDGTCQVSWRCGFHGGGLLHGRACWGVCSRQRDGPGLIHTWLWPRVCRWC